MVNSSCKEWFGVFIDIWSMLGGFTRKNKKAYFLVSMLVLGEVSRRVPSLYQVKVGGGWAVDRSSPHFSRMLRPAATLRCASGFTNGADTEK
jgi:hypothetical protein